VPVDTVADHAVPARDTQSVVLGGETIVLGAVESTLLSVKLADLGAGRLRAESRI
jgi:hypothetical protein